MTARLLETLVILSGVARVPDRLGPVAERVAGEIGPEARFGEALARRVDERISLPAGDPIGARDVAVLREAAESVFRVFAAGDWAPAAETLERLRGRIDASPASLATDVSLREALYDIRIMLGECYRRLGRDAEATAAMAEALRSDPKREPSTLRFSPDVLDFFKKVKRDLDAQPRGTLEVASDPPSLSVFVGGEFSGQTPAKLGDLYPGRYRVLAGTGAAGRAHEVTVQGAERLSIDQRFDRALHTDGEVALVFPDEAARAVHEAAYAARLGRSLGAAQVIVLADGTHRERQALVASLVDVETARPVRTGIVATEPAPPGDATLAALARFLARGEPAPGIVTRGGLAGTDAEVAVARPARWRAWKWTALGLSLAALAAGGTLLALDGGCARQTRTEACLDRRETTAPALVSVGLGAASAATSGVFFWLDAR